MLGTKTAPSATRPRLERRLLLLASTREVGILVVILLFAITVGARNPRFLTTANIVDILRDISPLVIVAVGQMMVIITRGIDLSVGSSLGLTAMLIGLLMRDNTWLNPWLTLPMGMAIGLILGTINALLVTRGGIPPIITTLATMSIYRGMVIVFSGGEWVDAYRIPAGFTELTKLPILGVPILILYAALILIGFYYFLNYTRTGREIYAVGSNPNAAMLAGIRVNHIKFLVFVITGVLAGLAGVLWASWYAAVANDTGTGFELQTIASGVIGGVNIMGGSGTVPGVLLGALLFGMIANALTVIGISPFWRLTVQGFIILFAVVLDALIVRRLQIATRVRRAA